MVRSTRSDTILREVIDTDLPILFEQQMDPEANQMAAFPARDRDAFMAHWSRILSDETLIKRTILFQGQVAGNIGCFEMKGVRQVGYWIGRQYWGRGIATAALSDLLKDISVRPLYAYVAKHNIASLRVLEKCGFVICGEEKDGEIEEVVLRLDESTQGNRR